MPEEIRIDDQFRDTGNQAEPQIGNIKNAVELDADEVPLTDPTTQTRVAIYQVQAKGAAVALTATPAITLPNDAATITGITYTPAGSVSAPTAGNSRTWTLAGTEGTIATYTLSNAGPAFVSGTPINFTVSHAAVSEEVLTLASSVVGTGAADPGGTLTVTFTI